MKRSWALAIIAVSLLFAGLQMWRGLHDVVDTDYIGFATAARVLESGSACIYCESVQHQAEEAYLNVTLPPGVQSAFANPAPALILVAPLAYLSPALGFAIFAGIAFVASAIATWLLASKFAAPAIAKEWRFGLAALAVWSLPASWGLALGQWDPLLLLAAVGGLALIHHGGRFKAGLLLAVVFCKPQLGWMLVPLFMVIGEWRVVAGLMVGVGSWLAGTIAMVGLGSIRDLMGIVLGQHVREAPRTIGVPGLVGSLFQSSPVVFVLSAVGLVVCSYLVWHQRDFWRQEPVALVALGLALSAILAPHVWSEDLIALAPLLVVWTRNGLTKVMVAAIALSGAYMVDLIVPANFAHLETLVQVGILYAFWVDTVGAGRSSDQRRTTAAVTIHADSA